MKAYAHQLQLYDRVHRSVLFGRTTKPTPWLNTKYLCFNTDGLDHIFQADGEASQDFLLSFDVIFEQSITDKELYVCIQLNDKMRENIKK